MKQILTSALRLAVVCGALALAACGGNTSGRAKTQDQAQTRSTAVLEIDELLAAADSLAGQTVTIEGVCTHTCKHGARKIFLMGSDDTQTIRVESGELGSFDPQCVNRVVRVTGRVDEERIDEAYLARWEAQVKAQTKSTARPRRDAPPRRPHARRRATPSRSASPTSAPGSRPARQPKERSTSRSTT